MLLVDCWVSIFDKVFNFIVGDWSISSVGAMSDSTVDVGAKFCERGSFPCTF